MLPLLIIPALLSASNAALLPRHRAQSKSEIIPRQDLRSITDSCPVRSFVNGSSTTLFGLCHTDDNGGGFVGSHVDLAACTRVVESRLEWSESGPGSDAVGSLVACNFKIGDDEPEERRWDAIECEYAMGTGTTRKAELSLSSSPLKLSPPDGRLACTSSTIPPSPRIGAVDLTCTYFWVYIRDNANLVLKAQCFRDAHLLSPNDQHDAELSLSQCLAWHPAEARLAWKHSAEPNGLNECDLTTAALEDENRRLEVDCQDGNGQTTRASVGLTRNVFNMNGLDCMDEGGGFLKSNFGGMGPDL